MSKIYEGSLKTNQYGDLLTEYCFYLDNDPLSLVIITHKNDKFFHIDWYLNNRHYSKFDMNKVPKKYQDLFNKLEKIVESGETNLDFFSI